MDNEDEFQLAEQEGEIKSRESAPNVKGEHRWIKILKRWTRRNQTLKNTKPYQKHQTPIRGVMESGDGENREDAILVSGGEL